MNKCFITKLPSSVDNDNLPVLGQLRFNWLKQSNLTDNDARAIGLSTNDSINIKVSGAHLTDNTLSSNLGNTKTITAADGLVWLYVSNETDAILTIDNKYSLTNLNFVKSNKYWITRSVKFDINDIRYCTALTAITLGKNQVSGDISAISQLTALNTLWLADNQVSGDISALRKLTALVNLNLGNTQVSGDISAISQLTALGNITLANTKISGDISAISKLTTLDNINLGNTQVSGDISAMSKLTALSYFYLSNTNLSGKIDSFANLTKLSDISGMDGLSLTGDMSKIPARVKFISQMFRKVNTNFTWTANGRQNATLLAMDGPIPFDTVSMDNMFIDQATCTLRAIESRPETKRINVRGNRTSASDEAVTAIQNMGVTITGVTKEG